MTQLVETSQMKISEATQEILQGKGYVIIPNLLLFGSYSSSWRKKNGDSRRLSLLGNLTTPHR